jgi:ABC-type glutathione transport system ATPase component
VISPALPWPSLFLCLYVTDWSVTEGVYCSAFLLKQVSWTIPGIPLFQRGRGREDWRETKRETYLMADQQTKAVQVSHLIKRYLKMKYSAVNDISFDVELGEIFGLLGPNGAGKTTTIGMLITMIVPTGGSIHIMGVDAIAHPTLTKQRIAVVPQRMNLDRSLSAREILTFHAGYHGVSKAQREATRRYAARGFRSGQSRARDGKPFFGRNGAASHAGPCHDA